MGLKLSWQLLAAVLSIIQACTCHSSYMAKETEMFSIPISPNLFNWTYQQFDQQYRFHASLVGKPELPSWLRYIYSGRHHSGFIFGTPPRGTKSPITLEVIGLNREDYETRRLLMNLTVQPTTGEKLARHEVHLKIDNLNVEDLLDLHRMDRLKEIFTRNLWTESDGELYATFLASAIDLGARLPLKPNEGEGLVVRLGSPRPFSSELLRLREEVQPLSRLASCPRDYKRTTVERLFRQNAFTLDWCSFKLFDTTYTDKSADLTEVLDDAASKNQHSTSRTSKSYLLPDAPAWVSPRKDSLPYRSYLREFTLAVVVPVLLMLISMTALTAVLCFHYVGMPDEESDSFFDNIFHLCEDAKQRRAQKTGKVELCRYGTGDTEQTHLPDNTSNKSAGISPNNSLARPYSPKSTSNLAANYNRPQPPPYMGSNVNSLLRRPGHNTEKTTPSTCSGNSPDHTRTTLALEESLKLLNEANIASAEYIDCMNMRNERFPILKDPIIDLIDGADDYVPVKAALGGYTPIKQDASEYGLNGLGKVI